MGSEMTPGLARTGDLVARSGMLEPMLSAEKAAIRVRAQRASALYPGPLGELARRKLLVFEEFGWRMKGNGDSLIGRLLAQIDQDWAASPAKS